MSNKSAEERLQELYDNGKPQIVEFEDGTKTGFISARKNIAPEDIDLIAHLLRTREDKNCIDSPTR